MREMILAETEEERQKALDILFEYQKAREWICMSVSRGAVYYHPPHIYMAVIDTKTYTNTNTTRPTCAPCSRP